LAIGGLGGVVANIPAGACVTKYGPRNVLLITVLVSMAASSLAAVPASGIVLLACFGCASLLAGVAESAGILCRQTMIGASVPKSLRGRASSYLGGVARLGYTIGPFFGGLIAHDHGPPWCMHSKYSWLF